MSTVRLLALGGLALAASACATVAPAPATLGPDIPTTLAAPEPTPDLDWFFHVDEEDASLAYGLAESDHLLLGLDCRRGSRALDLYALGDGQVDRELHLESGGDTERFPVQAESAGPSEADFLTAQARADIPVFKRFRDLGWIARWQGEERQVFVAHPGSADRIAAFFDFCG